MTDATISMHMLFKHLLLVLSLSLFKILSIYLRGRVREGEIKKDLPPNGVLPRYPQQLGLGWTRVSLSHGVQRTRRLDCPSPSLLSHLHYLLGHFATELPPLLYLSGLLKQACGLIRNNLSLILELCIFSVHPKVTDVPKHGWNGETTLPFSPFTL